MTEPLLRVIDLKTHFRIKASWMFGEKQLIKAVDGVSFDVDISPVVGAGGGGAFPDRSTVPL